MYRLTNVGQLFNKPNNLLLFFNKKPPTFRKAVQNLCIQLLVRYVVERIPVA